MVEAVRFGPGTLVILIFVAFLATPFGVFAQDEVTILTPPPTPSGLVAPPTPSVLVKPSDSSKMTLPPENGEEVKVELLTEPSGSEVVYGGEFYLTFKIIYHGSDSYWHVKSIDGPSLEGAVQLSHAVSSSVRKTHGVVICEEIHNVCFRATGTQVARVGSVSVVLLGKGGAVRHLRSTPLEIKIEPVFLGGHVKIPVFGFFLSFAAFLGVILLAVVFKVRRRRMLMEQESVDSSSDLSRDEMAAVLLKSIEQLKSSSSGDVKVFYKKSLEIIKSGLELNLPTYDGSNDDSFSFENVPNMPASLDRGLKKVVSDENLVRFAGLKPSAEECEQVCSRLKEFITLNIDHGL